jgi:LAO/AO transport system kinase
MLQMGGGRSEERVMHHGQLMEVTPAVGSQPPVNDPGPDRWRVPVVVTVATEGQGLDDLMSAVHGHMASLKAGGGWRARELARSRQEIGQLLRDEFIARLTAAVPAGVREELIAAVAERQIDPYAAVERLFAEVNG